MKMFTYLRLQFLLLTSLFITLFSFGQCPGGTVTWNGTWSGTPDLTTEVIIDANYNTTTDGGSFIACSLVVNNGTLTISDGYYVEVENDLTVAASGVIIINPQGAFVQNNDLGLVTVSGNSTVEKNTSPLNVWYEYTYWSSPVSGETVGSALSDSDASRRYEYVAQNFVDATAEVTNDNTTGAGQDDVDDNGDDWKWVNSSTVMQPGLGYAATHSEAFFIGPPLTSPPFQFTYTFVGPFNNGEITVPVYRNDSELNDNNWNLIGNPYPSAIDADLFLAANSSIDTGITATNTVEGAIFFWSQNTAPSGTTNGNQAYNFSDADYAIINGSSEIAGGDGLAPNRFIPSGQAFFVSYSDAATPISTVGDISEGSVVFNNAMRVKGATDNSQFFKNTKSKDKSTSVANKLWVNLTSDNGVFNQTSIAYVNGATNNDDGAYFDAQKNVSSGTSAILYSTIPNSTKKFAIQGKDVNSLNTNETIQLGFKTTIAVATLYKLSVAQIEGAFLSSNTIYLKDNETNTTHNLSASDYTFTSAVGEFNNRFEIMFSNAALTNTNFDVNDNRVKITNLENNTLTFKASNNLNINRVAIYDLLGRQLYTFKGKNNEESYSLSNLNTAVIIANITLSNGTVLKEKVVMK